MAAITIVYYLLSLIPTAFWWGMGAGALVLGIVLLNVQDRRLRREQKKKSAG